jgi:hypothetical protein
MCRRNRDTRWVQSRRGICSGSSTRMLQIWSRSS